MSCIACGMGGTVLPIATCKRCGKLFNKVTLDICPDCVRKEEVLFDEIKLFLRTHENATIEEVVEALDVDEELVVKFLRDGRLVASKKMTYPCAECGKPISTGKYCPDCLKNMMNTVNSLKESIINSQKKGPGYFSRSDDR